MANQVESLTESLPAIRNAQLAPNHVSILGKILTPFFINCVVATQYT